MKRMMNGNKKDEKKMAKGTEMISQAFENLFGRGTPVALVMDCKEDEEKDEKNALLEALEEYLARNGDACSCDNPEECCVPGDSDCKDIPVPEGDGEEIFDEMLSDLISFADMVERLEMILMAVSYGRMCPLRAMRTAEDMVDTVSEVLVKWATYKEPTA